MQDLNDLFFFAQVANHGGFAAAGRALGAPKSKLSRRVALLEARLGARLLNRSSRRFSLTEIGRAYLERCEAMLVEAEAADELVAAARAQPRGVVRVSCPISLISFQFAPLFARFMSEFPQIEVHLDATNRRVDPVAEAIDVAIRVRFPPLEPSELMLRRLDESSQCLVAAPSLIGAALAAPADLAGLPSLDLGPPQRRHAWTLIDAQGQSAVVPHRPRLITDDMAALREGALAGVGVVQLPTMIIWRDVEAGRLVQLLPGWRPRAGVIQAVFPTRRGLLPSVRALIDFLTRECAAQRREAARSLAP